MKPILVGWKLQCFLFAFLVLLLALLSGDSPLLAATWLRAGWVVGVIFILGWLIDGWGWVRPRLGGYLRAAVDLIRPK